MSIPVPSDIRDEKWIEDWLKQEKDVANIHQFYTNVIVPEYDDLNMILPEKEDVKGWFERSSKLYTDLHNKFKTKWPWFRTNTPSNEDLVTLRMHVSGFVNRARKLRSDHAAPYIKLKHVELEHDISDKEQCAQCFKDRITLENEVYELTKKLNPNRAEVKSYHIFNPGNGKGKGGRSGPHHEQFGF